MAICKSQSTRNRCFKTWVQLFAQGLIELHDLKILRPLNTAAPMAFFSSFERATSADWQSVPQQPQRLCKQMGPWQPQGSKVSTSAAGNSECSRFFNLPSLTLANGGKTLSYIWRKMAFPALTSMMRPHGNLNQRAPHKKKKNRTGLCRCLSHRFACEKMQIWTWTYKNRARWRSHKALPAGFFNAARLPWQAKKIVHLTKTEKNYWLTLAPTFIGDFISGSGSDLRNFQNLKSNVKIPSIHLSIAVKIPEKIKAKSQKGSRYQRTWVAAG